MPEYHTRLVPHHGGTQPQSRGLQPNQNKLDINYYAKYVNSRHLHKYSCTYFTASIINFDLI